MGGRASRDKGNPEWLRPCFVRLARGWQCTVETNKGKVVSRCQIQHRKREVGEECMRLLLIDAIEDARG